MSGYPTWFRPALLGTLLLMLLSGLLLVPTTLVMRADLSVAWRLPGSGRILCAALHAGAGFALMLFVGALWSLHMRSGWRRRQQRVSGLLVSALLLALVLSAIAVYYAGDESFAALAAWLHLGAGVALLGPFGWHWLHGHRARQQVRSVGRRRNSAAQRPLDAAS